MWCRWCGARRTGEGGGDRGGEEGARRWCALAATLSPGRKRRGWSWQRDETRIVCGCGGAGDCRGNGRGHRTSWWRRRAARSASSASSPLLSAGRGLRDHKILQIIAAAQFASDGKIAGGTRRSRLEASRRNSAQPRHAPEGGASPPTMSGLPSDEPRRLRREEWKRLPDNPRAPHGPWMQVRSRTTDRRR